VTGGEAPENVRIVIDGREYPCDMLRDPDLDRDGLAAWVAVPREPLPPAGRDMTLRAGMLPGNTMLVFHPGMEIPPP
jgi:hypothetical protein